jgi:hypothetical protein
MYREAGLRDDQSLPGSIPMLWSPFLGGLLRASWWRRHWAGRMLLRRVSDHWDWSLSLFVTQRRH